MRKLPLLLALATALALAASTPTARADVVPPSPCPEGEVWRGAHDGECRPCEEGTHWERIRDTEYGECAEGEASGGCAVSPGAPAGAPFAFGALVLALAFGRRRRR